MHRMNYATNDAQTERIWQRIETIAHLLDSAIEIPGTGIRFGLDPILGLFPGIGDVISAGLSLYIVFNAKKLGVRGPVLTKMLFNVAIDTGVGAIPVLGDLFDFAYKSNEKNLELIKQVIAERYR